MPQLKLSRRSFHRIGGAALLTAGAPMAWAQPALPEGVFENFATLQVKPQRRAAFLAALRANAVASRAAPGNIGFNIYQTAQDAGRLYVFEQWQGRDAYAVHMRQPALLAMHAAASTDLAAPIDHEFLIPAVPGTGAQWAVVDEPRESVNIFVQLQTHPGMRAVLIEKIKPLLVTFRGAEGNISFDLYASPSDPNALMQVERWVNTDLHNANLKRPVIGAIRAAFTQTLARPLADSRLLLEDITQG